MFYDSLESGMDKEYYLKVEMASLRKQVDNKKDNLRCSNVMFYFCVYNFKLGGMVRKRKENLWVFDVLT